MRLTGALAPEGSLPERFAERWAGGHPGFEYVPVISDAAGRQWSGEWGFVHRAVMEDLPTFPATSYACGVPIMVDSRTARFHTNVPAAGKRILRRFLHHRRDKATSAGLPRRLAEIGFAHARSRAARGASPESVISPLSMT